MKERQKEMEKEREIGKVKHKDAQYSVPRNQKL